MNGLTSLHVVYGEMVVRSLTLFCVILDGAWQLFHEYSSTLYHKFNHDHANNSVFLKFALNKSVHSDGNFDL